MLPATRKFLWLTLVTLVASAGCGRQAKPELTHSEGWNFPDEAEVPDITGDLNSSDWKRIDGPVTNRPDAYAGESSASESRPGVFHTRDFLYVDSRRKEDASPRNAASPYLPDSNTQLVDVVRIDPNTGAHQPLPGLVDYASSAKEDSIQWMADPENRLMVAFASGIALRSSDGSWSEMLAVETDAATSRKHGVLGEAVYASFRRKGDETDKLWRWTPEMGWTEIHSTAQEVNLLRSRNAGDAILTKTANDEFHWSRDGGDTWRNLRPGKQAGDSAKLDSSWSVERAYATANEYVVAPYDSGSERPTIWRSPDMETWSRESIDSTEIAYNDPSAETPRGVLFLPPSDDPLYNRNGVFITSDGRSTVPLPAIDSTLDNPGAEVLEVYAVGGTWVAATPDTLWVTDNFDSGWRALDLRLPATTELSRYGPHIAFHQEAFAHLRTDDANTWTSHQIVSLDENGNTTEAPLYNHGPIVGDGNHLFILSSKPHETSGGEKLFFARVADDGTAGPDQALDPGNLDDDTIDRTVSWRGKPTTYDRKTGLLAAQNGLSDWQKIGPPVTSDRLESAGTKKEPYVVPRLTPFHEKLYAIVNLSRAKDNAIIRWDEPDEFVIDLHSIPREPDKDENATRRRTTPISLFRTNDALLVQTDDRPAVSTIGESSVTPKPFLFRSQERPWAWFAWPDPPGRDIINKPEANHTAVVPGPHALFVLSEGPELFRYNPESRSWADLPIPPTLQRISPDGFAVASDSSHLYFAGARGGLWRLDLT